VRLAISVSPPWWNSWWFRALVAALLVCSAWAFLQFRLRRQAHEFSLRLEERVGERTRIARELHDTLLQSFQGTLYFFQAARNLFSHSPEEALNTLDSAIASADEAIAEGRDAIHNLRGAASERRLEDLLNSAGRELRDAHDPALHPPAFQVIVEGQPQSLSPLVQDEIYRIAREVLRNAFQHAAATRIEACVQYDPDLFRVRIRDNGTGIDPKVLQAGARPGHFGLPGIRERAKRIGAALKLWSEAGAGTEVELTLPAQLAYGTVQHRRRLRLFRKIKVAS
jgi:signal transduction histidine kinase